jgi:hypothetical protein
MKLLISTMAALTLVNSTSAFAEQNTPQAKNCDSVSGSGTSGAGTQNAEVISKAQINSEKHDEHMDFLRETLRGANR